MAPPDKPGSASAHLHVETCPPNNVIAFDNAIQIIEIGELRMAIWGDNRAAPDPALDHYLKNVDCSSRPSSQSSRALRSMQSSGNMILRP